MTKRTISEEFWGNPTLAGVSVEARYLLLGCWSVADDEGILPWQAAILRERVFPHDTAANDRAVEVLMRELVTYKFVHVYKSPRGQWFGYIAGFERDQYKYKRTPSKQPPPPISDPMTYAHYAYRDKYICTTCRLTVVDPTKHHAPEAVTAGGFHGVLVWPEGKHPFPSLVTLSHERCKNGDRVTSELLAALNDTTVEPEAVAPEPTPQTPDDADDADDALFDVPEGAGKPARKPRKKPSYVTPELEATAKDVLTPWWKEYGTGWPQSYAVVRSVILAALKNKMRPEEIARAMDILGPQKRPVSGGAIAFALANPTKQHKEEEVLARRNSSKTADKYLKAASRL